jgi:hypothetical protein
LGQQQAPTLALDGTILDLGRGQRPQQRNDRDHQQRGRHDDLRQGHAAMTAASQLRIADCGLRIEGHIQR